MPRRSFFQSSRLKLTRVLVLSECRQRVLSKAFGISTVWLLSPRRIISERSGSENKERDSGLIPWAENRDTLRIDGTQCDHKICRYGWMADDGPTNPGMRPLAYGVTSRCELLRGVCARGHRNYVVNRGPRNSMARESASASASRFALGRDGGTATAKNGDDEVVPSAGRRAIDEEAARGRVPRENRIKPLTE